MAMLPTYSAAQCRWMADRYREGYSIADLSALAGSHRATITRCLVRVGAKPENRETLVPLDSRRAEFDALAESRETRSCPVCGRARPVYQVADEDGTLLGCEDCLTIRRNGLIER